MRAETLVSSLVALALLAGPSHAAIVFSDLGTDPPPTSVGPVPVTPFNIAPQAAIPDGDILFAIPGNPIGGFVGLSSPTLKLTVPDTWLTWSHGYRGPVFAFPDNVTLILPSPTRAFYLYVEPNAQDLFRVTATANDGTTSGPILVDGLGGANGFGFFTDNPSQSIVSILIEVDADAEGFAIAEFGIGASASVSEPPANTVPTLTEWGMIFLVGLLVLGGLRQLAGRRIA